MNHQIISHQRLCNPHCLRLYLMVLGLLALWEGRSEVVLGCLGALLTLSGYGDTERDMTGSGNKTATPRRCRLGVADVCCGLLFLLA